MDQNIMNLLEFLLALLFIRVTEFILSIWKGVVEMVLLILILISHSKA